MLPTALNANLRGCFHLMSAPKGNAVLAESAATEMETPIFADLAGMTDHSPDKSVRIVILCKTLMPTAPYGSHSTMHTAHIVHNMR